MAIIYLDNAASTWPKPPGVKERMAEAIEDFAANPGRGGHTLAMKASKTVFRTRVQLSRLFGIQNPNNLFFYLNATQALNQAIKGYLKAGDHVIASSVEHNSVRRPIEYMRREHQVEATFVEPRADFLFHVEDFVKAIQPNTRLLVVSHASNLTGVILPIAELGQLAKERGIAFLVDASQTAGVLPIHVEEMKIDMLAFPGHKGLYGPQGTGGLYVHGDIDLEPLIHGGTGSQSEAIDQPTTRPDRYESGTLNTAGLAGLQAGVDFILERGVDRIREHEWELAKQTIIGLQQIPGVQVYGPGIETERVSVIAFNIGEVDASEVSFILDQQYGIATRSGYHCTPLGHQTVGTEQRGAVRASFGIFNTEKDVEALMNAVREIASAFS
ncbi:aminotransferase class V-fold PLP-dependent enzyme [Brevibacillus sp. FSL K6-0770]|jgi:cysteine desulfurase family protein|uniref:aminotransferase class V-fold PLP-dependent enzyme n=1 Tax=Brevibacillus TaxID=55080 RepID=UPI000ED57782|nr:MULTISPECIES: aminotransferase class V-fold PLP-dependent enzyme [Brevibacillus]MDH6351505.1 cysteine desulfurase family protein [Brevibacillus sp. 1238]HBZ82978.1 cysteine desulfurase [Brevibacillus sp.]